MAGVHMQNKLIYSLDTSALLDARVRYYPPDVFPKLWDKFEDIIEGGTIRASELVKKELERKDDEVLKWAKSMDLFLDVDEEIQIEVSKILKQFPRLVAEGGQRSMGDPFVIALAKVKKCTVVTSEDIGTEKSPRIPYVCQELRVNCISILDLIRKEGWSF